MELFSETEGVYFFAFKNVITREKVAGLNGALLPLVAQCC